MSGVTLQTPDDKEIKQLANALKGRGRLSAPNSGRADKKDKDSPATTSLAYDAMRPSWAKIDALLGGTAAMRAAGLEYLPQHAEESITVYNERLQAATLFNMLEQTLNSWVGRPFSDPVHVSDDMPEEFKEWMADVDQRGNNIDVFAREWFRDGLAKSLSHVYVDMPRKKTALGPDGKPLPRTLADDRTSGARPYLCHIKPENLIFAYAETIDGVETLTQIRIRECETVMDGFAELQKETIRVVTPGHVDLYEVVRIRGKEKWVKVDEYDYDLDYIPLVTFYANRTGFMMGKPPLTDLADLNIAHWQSSSDQRQILTTARFPVLALSGANDDDNKLTVGPNHWLYCPDPQGKFYYVEHTGAAIESGRKDLQDLENQMAQYGAEFMKKRLSGETATARALDSAEATSPLQDAANRFTDALNMVLYVMADWVGKGESNYGSLAVTNDFGPEDANDADFKTLLEMRKSRDLSRTTFLDEMKRRGLLSDEFDIDAENELLEKELMTAFDGASTTDLDPDQPPEEDEDEPAGATSE